jgi:hypothetical protein
LPAGDAPARISQGFLGGITPTGRAAAVKSEDYEKVFMVAVEFTGPGIDKPQVAVWATNDLNAGSIMAVDALAGEFSDWAKGSETDASMSSSDDGVQEAKDCLSA